MNVLQVENLIRSYRKSVIKESEEDVKVLKGISFQVAEGEFVGIMGKSGCGKTTLLKTLGMIDKPTDGTIKFMGEDTSELYGDKLADIRNSKIGFIFQDFYLMDSLSVEENIMLPMIISKQNINKMIVEAKKYAEQFQIEYLLKKMDDDKSVVAITAGTPTVMGFTADMRANAGKQFVDVGIAEETAVALASGIAANGGKPVFGVYSSFIQRAYDQITQDVCINGNAVTFAVFAGSVYGMNDVTHLGLQDIPMLNSIPGLVYLAPVTKEDYIAMLDWSLTQNEYPVAIKVPGGSMISTGVPVTKDFSKLDTYEITKKGSRVAILGLGTFYETAVKAANILKTSHGIDATVINPYYISGIDADTLNELKKDHAVVATLEDGYLEGGFGTKIAAYYGSSDMKVLNFGIKKEFIDRYDASEVLKDNHLTPEQIAEDIAATL